MKRLLLAAALVGASALTYADPVPVVAFSSPDLSLDSPVTGQPCLEVKGGAVSVVEGSTLVHVASSDVVFYGIVPCL